MKLSVAANWDIELLDGLAHIPEVTSVYAKLPYDLVGGGRAGSVLPSVDLAAAAAYIREAHKRGLSFSYLLNAPCLGNLEQTQEGKERLLAFVGRLVELGVDNCVDLELGACVAGSAQLPGIEHPRKRAQLAHQSAQTEVPGIPWR